MPDTRRLVGLIALVGGLGALGGFVVPSSAQDPEDENVGTSTGPLEVRAVVRITKRGTGSGTVRGDPVAVHCAADRCKTLEPVAVGDHETLIADPDPGSRFVRWEGAPCGTKDTCRLKVGPVTTVTVVFDKRPTIVLTPSGPRDPKPEDATPQDPKPHESKSQDSKPQDSKRQNTKPENSEPPPKPPKPAPKAAGLQRPFVARVGRHVLVRGVRPRRLAVTVGVNVRSSIQLALQTKRGRRVTSRTWTITSGRRVLELVVPSRHSRRGRHLLRVTAWDGHGHVERFTRRVYLRR